MSAEDLNEEVQTENEKLNLSLESNTHDLFGFIERAFIIQEEFVRRALHKEVRKANSEELRSSFTEIMRVVMEQNNVIHNLTGIINEKEKTIETLTAIMEKPPMKTYAQALKTKEEQATRKQEFKDIVKAKQSVRVIPRDGKENVNTIKMIKSKVDPKDLDIGITGIKSLNRGGVIIECENREDANKLIERIKDIDEFKDHTCEKMEKRKPQLVLYNVDPEIDSIQLIEQIYDYNEEISNVGEIQIKYNYKGRNGNNWIISLNPNDFRKIIRKKKLKIKWSVVEIKEYLKPMLCYKCGRFGHISKYCKNESKCLNCGGNHEIKNCDKDTECLNCKYSNSRFKTNYSLAHRCNENSCPIWIKEIQRITNITDYGDTDE